MSNAKHYINRDLSWLEFNRRVMEEVEDSSTPLLERLQFLSIVTSNLDEFMSVRVAGLMEGRKAGYTKPDFSGYTPQGLIKRIAKKTHRIMRQQYRIYRDLLRLLEAEGIVLSQYRGLTEEQKKAMQAYFHDIVFPVLTPMAVDASRPFPLVHSKGLYLAAVLQQEKDPGESEQPERYCAIVQVPAILSRTITVPVRKNSRKRVYLLLEDLIKERIGQLFDGYHLEGIHAFRVTRNSDLMVNEEGAEDLLQEIEKELRRRRRGVPVCLEVEKGIHPHALALLMDELEVTEEELVEIDGPLDLGFLSKFGDQIPHGESLKYPKVEPVYPVEFDYAKDMLSVLRERDVLVYHPYESFDVVNDFILEVADDPDVLAIKMTLYRVSADADLIKALVAAAAAGKQVTVVVELKARFDEERNIAWARQLENAGCHVVYGLVGLKTHAKITLVVRREEGALRRYVHVGTGNYNEKTAKLYTDVGLFTCNEGIGSDASALFNEMTGYSTPHDWRAFAVAPLGMRPKLFEMIDRAIAHAAAGGSARLIAKMNSLSHQPIIDKLYEASQAGVKIELIVRGVCCLRPGVPQLSDNIRVISIVDRFLEHSRIVALQLDEELEVHLSSADWMTRNLTRRVELMCPVYDPELRMALMNMLQLNLRDNVKARELTSTGAYMRVPTTDPAIRSQFLSTNIERWKSGDYAR